MTQSRPPASLSRSMASGMQAASRPFWWFPARDAVAVAIQTVGVQDLLSWFRVALLSEAVGTPGEYHVQLATVNSLPRNLVSRLLVETRNGGHHPSSCLRQGQLYLLRYDPVIYLAAIRIDNSQRLTNSFHRIVLLTTDKFLTARADSRFPFHYF